MNGGSPRVEVGFPCPGSWVQGPTRSSGIYCIFKYVMIVFDGKRRPPPRKGVAVRYSWFPTDSRRLLWNLSKRLEVSPRGSCENVRLYLPRVLVINQV